MDTARQFWRPMINVFNPIGTVRPEEIRQLFVDRHADNPTRSLVQRLTLNLQNSLGQPQPYKGLLIGHVGSGKTCELIRLGQELGRDFLVVWFDAEMSLTAEKANHFDVLLGMGLAVHTAAESVGLRLPAGLLRDFVNSFARVVRKYEERRGFSLRVDQLLQQVFALALTTGAGVVAGAPAAAGMQGVLKATRLELNVRDELVRILDLPANRVQVIGALNALIEATQCPALNGYPRSLRPHR